MNMSLKFLAILFGGALCVSFVGTVILRYVMLWLGIVDKPDAARKAHGAPVAYEGGVAMYAAVLAGLGFAFWRVPLFVFDVPLFVAVVIGATATVAVGVADDLLDLRAWLKLACQLGIGAYMYSCGFGIEKITNPFGGELLFHPAVSLLTTMFWYALLMNAINMIDGLDGLAAGIVGISALTLAVVAYGLGQPFGVVLSLVTAAACFGFLPMNFNPAKIFMGDAGSLLLGFLLATQTLISSSKSPAMFTLLVPMLAIGLPLFDLLFAFVRRLVSGTHPFKPDRRHLHHRFLAAGFSQRRTVLLFYYLTALLGIIALVLQKTSPTVTLITLAVTLVGCMLLLENLRFLEARVQSSKQ